jgi:hypothetical protein
VREQYQMLVSETIANARFFSLCYCRTIAGMDLHELRRDRLNRLIEKMGGQAVFLEKTGMNQGQVSALQNGGRNMGEKLARKIERMTGTANMYLDGGEAEDPMTVIQGGIERADWMSAEDKAYFIRQIEWLRNKAGNQQP